MSAEPPPDERMASEKVHPHTIAGNVFLHLHAGRVSSRGIPGVQKFRNGQCFRRRSNVLPGGNCLGDRQTQRRRDGYFRLDWAPGRMGDRSRRGDLLDRSGP